MMLELRQLIQAKLDQLLTYPVFFMRAPSPGTFPYAVWGFFGQTDDGESTTTGSIEVDGWGTTRNTTILEGIMDQVELMDKIVLVGTTFRVVFYKESTLYLDDDNPDIRRIKQTYNYKIFRSDR